MSKNLATMRLAAPGSDFAVRKKAEYDANEAFKQEQEQKNAELAQQLKDLQKLPKQQGDQAMDMGRLGPASVSSIQTNIALSNSRGFGAPGLGPIGPHGPHGHGGHGPHGGGF